MGADDVFLDFSDGGFRQFFNKLDHARALVAGQPLNTEIHQRLLIDAFPVFEDHVGGGQLAPIVVRNAEHGAFIDRRVAVESVFDLRRIDVFAARNDHVLGAVDQKQKPVFIDIANVAGADPAIRIDRRLGGFGVLVIADHHMHAAGHQFANLAGRKRIIVRIEDGHIQICEGAPSAGHLGGTKLRRAHRKIARFRLAVLFHPDYVRQDIQHLLHLRYWVGGAAEIAVAPAFKPLRRKIWVADDAVDLGRDHEGRGNPVFLDQAHEFLGVPSGHQNQRVADQHAGLKPDEQPGDMKQRRRAAEHIVLGKSEFPLRPQAADHPRLMPGDDAFGKAGGAAGIGDGESLIVGERHIGRGIGCVADETGKAFRAFGRRAADSDDPLQPWKIAPNVHEVTSQPGIYKNRLDISAVDNILQFAKGEPRRQMRQYRARPRRAEIDDGVVGLVGGIDANVVTLAEARRYQGLGKPVGGAVQLAIGL